MNALDCEALLAPLAKARALLLAVSGGPDSVALMLLAARWSGRSRRAIAVATVDHGLRPGSGDEARRVGEWATALGFTHHLLTFAGDKPVTRIQERARAARYALLTQCALEIGAEAIVTAHHADDQAETILFRLTRGSGVAGLAGMAASSKLGERLLLRPLLGLRKQQLEAYCIAAGHPFLRDPSNENPAFARTRLRKLRGLLETQGLDAAALARLGERAARAELALAWSAASIADALPALRALDEFSVAARALREMPRDILQRILAAEIARLSGASPRLERLERAAAKLAEALAAGTNAKLTIGGTAVAVSKDALTMRRETPRRNTTA
ncbi:MAG: tRNA lysidine(34) synthetase TilS [Methylocystis sp.]|nr:tRNA lysidine(34) synthetase TilS [Methylocystis sp.]